MLGCFLGLQSRDIYIVSAGYKTAVDGAVIRYEFSFLSPSGQSAIKLFDNCTPLLPSLCRFPNFNIHSFSASRRSPVLLRIFNRIAHG